MDNDILPHQQPGFVDAPALAAEAGVLNALVAWVAHARHFATEMQKAQLEIRMTLPHIPVYPPHWDARAADGLAFVHDLIGDRLSEIARMDDAKDGDHA